MGVKPAAATVAGPGTKPIESSTRQTRLVVVGSSTSTVTPGSVPTSPSTLASTAVSARRSTSATSGARTATAVERLRSQAAGGQGLGRGPRAACRGDQGALEPLVP